MGHVLNQMDERFEQQMAHLLQFFNILNPLYSACIISCYAKIEEDKNLYPLTEPYEKDRGVRKKLLNLATPD